MMLRLLGHVFFCPVNFGLLWTHVYCTLSYLELDWHGVCVFAIFSHIIPVRSSSYVHLYVSYVGFGQTFFTASYRTPAVSHGGSWVVFIYSLLVVKGVPVGRLSSPGPRCCRHVWYVLLLSKGCFYKGSPGKETLLLLLWLHPCVNLLTEN